MVLLFRKIVDGRNSIENVFIPLEKISGIERLNLPCDLRSVRDLMQLIWFGIRLKKKNIHITGDIHYMAFILFWKKTILTIHDCNRYEDLTGFRKWLMGLIWFELPIRAANKVTVISPHVKEQVQSHFNLPDQKVIVIPNSFIPIPKSRNKKYSEFTILAIGSLPHKNIERLILAIKDITDCSVFILGRIRPELAVILAQNQVKFVNKFNVEREELNEIYQRSHVLFFASLKEGFGLPILEAQSCGLPVITSNISSMPYVAGDGALLVDPYNTSEIRDAILRIMDNSQFTLELIAKGFENLQRFNQKQFISSFEKLYKEVFGNSK